MLEVLTPATATALTTPERARAVLGFPATDDAVAATLIAQASRAIGEYCRRVFAIETVRETFFDNDLCGEGPMLARGPVVSVLSVTSNGTAVPVAESRLDERTGRLRRRDADGRALPWWGGSLVVEYRAGYVLPSAVAGAPAPTLPETVERAAITLLSTYLGARSRDAGIKSESVEGIGSTSWWVPGESDRLVSPEAERLLGPHVRFYP